MRALCHKVCGGYVAFSKRMYCLKHLYLAVKSGIVRDPGSVAATGQFQELVNAPLPKVDFSQIMAASGTQAGLSSIPGSDPATGSASISPPANNVYEVVEHFSARRDDELEVHGGQRVRIIDSLGINWVNSCELHFIFFLKLTQRQGFV
jgi:hypothetical protein